MPELLPAAVLSDLDGTLAIANGRRYNDFSRVITDRPDPIVKSLLEELSRAGNLLLFMTGRPALCRADTSRWIQDIAGLPMHELLMRGNDDWSPDAELKHRLYREHIFGKYSIQLVLEDKRSVVDMWRQQGLRAFEVANNDK